MKIFERKFSFSKPLGRARNLGVKVFPYYEFNRESGNFHYYEEEDGYWIESDGNGYTSALWEDSNGGTAIGLEKLVGPDKLILISSGNKKYSKGYYNGGEFVIEHYVIEHYGV